MTNARHLARNLTRLFARLLPQLVAVAGLALPAVADAQPRLVTIYGIAFDSLRNEPLDQAFITIVGQPRSAVSDSRGRFRFDSIAPGTYVLAMQHEVLDSLGLSGASARWTIVDGTEEVRVSVPSFRTFWRSVCGGEPPARDTGFVYGTVRQPDGRTPVRGATVTVSWMDLVNRGTAQEPDIIQRRYARDAESDADGGYGICGIPRDVIASIQANTDSTMTGVVDLASGTTLVRRRDLVLGAAEAPGAPTGNVTGLVSDSAGIPQAGVRVAIDAVPEVRTDSAGRFTVLGVPTGTRQVEFIAVGRVPYTTSVDVVAGETVSISARLKRVTALDVVRVIGSAETQRRVRELEERRRGGMGYVRDSSDFPQFGTPLALYATLPGLQVVPGRGARRFLVTMPSMGGGRCVATIFLDGIRQPDQEILSSLLNDEIAAVEVYPRTSTVPTLFQSGYSACGVVAVWTKYGLWRR
jgi:hypothetical protein